MKTLTQEELRRYESEGLFIEMYALEVPPSPNAPAHPRFELVAVPALSPEPVKLATWKGDVRQVRFAPLKRIVSGVIGRKELTVKFLDSDEPMPEEISSTARKRAPSKKASK